MRTNSSEKKFIYLFFHLNLFFSSLPQKKRKEVINKCYWPLLNLIDKSDFNIGLEISGWTLKEIKKIDNKWIIYFKRLLKEKKTYLIGSSYTQAILPLIPYEVNNYNIEYGKKIYKKLLNQNPKIAYVNEQCFSKSVVDLYRNHNYESLIMDWDCIKSNPNLNQKLKFYPQKLKGNKKTINVIWNSSSNFQNFQKIIHSKMSENEYFENFNQSNLFKEGVVSIYGSDAEIFDFRLKRFENESNLSNKNYSEWSKIYSVLSKFKKRYSFINLNQLHKIDFKSKFSNQIIDITTLKNIIPTKKQKKYNPLRWYVGGQNNYLINTLCWKIFLNSNKSEKILKKLCYFWSSDFRTHIEKSRWKDFLQYLKKYTNNINEKNSIKNILLSNKLNITKPKKEDYIIKNDKEYINYSDKKVFFTFDKERGLTLKSLGLIVNGKHHSFIKKYNQGNFVSDKLNVDYYNGHNVLENTNFKYSDLDKRGKINIIKKNSLITFRNKFYIKKIISITKYWFFDINEKILYLHNNIKINSRNEEFLSIRSNFFNINHKIFNLKYLKIYTNNGGSEKEFFSFNKSEDFFHDEPLSSKFTAQNCFGNTDGEIIFSDNKKKIIFKVFHELGISAPMLCFQKDRNNSYFLRFLSSFKENNDVKIKSNNKAFESLISIRLIQN